MANANDGTQLGSGEVISSETVSNDSSALRRDPNLPATQYKVPRSKIAVGPYGVDGGDATPDQPLPVESAIDRRIQETILLRDRELTLLGMRQLYAEQISLVDVRGHVFMTRGVR